MSSTAELLSARRLTRKKERRNQLLKDIRAVVTKHYTQTTHKPLPGKISNIINIAKIDIKRAIRLVNKNTYPVGSWEYNAQSELMIQLESNEDKLSLIPEPIQITKQTPKERAIIIRQSKADKRRQFRWQIKSAAQKLLRKKISSSFVHYLSYNIETGTVNCILGKKKYSFLNIHETIFNAWRKGAASCKTSDTGKKKEWWIGKTPSLGAFFNQHIKNKSFIKGWVD